MTDQVQICRFTIGPFAENCYLLIGPSGRTAGLVDPGLGSEVVLDSVRERELDLEWIINTHGHVDHVAGNRFFKDQTGARLILHPADAQLAANASQQLASLQLMGLGTGLRAADSPPPDDLFEEGKPFVLDGVRFDVIHTPGHSPGGVCMRSGQSLIVGDTLFRGSIGRTDLPGGSHPQLIASVREKLFCLPGDTVCYPGHGPETTIDTERRTNPFFISDSAVGIGP
jgi:glyoxylase-like metal-dependent hydrolase (beta-lactamase superfamily II)